MSHLNETETNNLATKNEVAQWLKETLEGNEKHEGINPHL